MLVAAHARRPPPGERPVRGGGDALRRHGRAVAAVVLRPGRATRRRRSAGPTTSSGASRTSRPCTPTCGTAPHQQDLRRRLWPDDPDGRAWGDPATRLPVRGRAAAATSSSTPGNYPAGTRNFSALIGAFRGENAGRPGRGAGHRGLHGVLAAGRPAAVPAEDRHDRQGAPVPVRRGGARRARGEPGHRGLVVAAATRSPRRSPARPRSSSRTPTRWPAAGSGSQPIGFAHALFEVAAKAFATVQADRRPGRAWPPRSRQMRIDTVVGPLDWTADRSRTWPRRRWSAGSGGPDQQSRSSW